MLSDFHNIFLFFEKTRQDFVGEYLLQSSIANLVARIHFSGPPAKYQDQLPSLSEANTPTIDFSSFRA